MSRFLLAACIAVILAGAWRPLADAVERPVIGVAPVLTPIEGSAGWQPSSALTLAWRPLYVGATARLEQTFSKDGTDVSVFVEYYRGQTKGHELITTGNAIVSTESKQWKFLASRADVVDWNGKRVVVHLGEIAGGNVRLVEFDTLWIAGRLTTSPFVGKALQAWSKLSGKGDDGAVVVVATRITAEGRDERAWAILQDFAAAMTPAIERSLEAARISGR